ncbi:MAG: type II toxin-antitoxin system VapC family toxin [Fibromonadaceae bacterium]|jgi:tRNA(fMet)-specific endonuclease VapC|nr:type II toxin-antitoxin system VapC family toxin [Fibromonadaceae bacterium]
MKKYLLDTNICIFLFKNKYGIGEKIKQIGGLDSCCISEITLAELKFGVELSENKNHNAKLVENFSKEIIVLPILNCLNVFAKEKAKLKKIGNLIDDFDILIGSSAISNDLIMVTDNEKHFDRLNGIVIENWVERI